MQLNRDEILNALSESLALQEHVVAMWEAGSAATKRVDQYSDIDISFIVDDQAVDKTAADIEANLTLLSQVEKKWIVPKPTWHGHDQIYFKLANASPFLFVDCCIMKKSSGNKFIEATRHGEMQIYFDKENLLDPNTKDFSDRFERIQSKLQELGASYEFCFSTVKKEILRNRTPDAIGFYYNIGLRKLVELLNIIHRPEKFDFGFRYLKEDFPKEVYQKIENLFFIKNNIDLEEKLAIVEQTFEKAWKRLKATSQ